MMDDILREIIQRDEWESGNLITISSRPSRLRRLWAFLTRRKIGPQTYRARTYETAPGESLIVVNYEQPTATE